MSNNDFSLGDLLLYSLAMFGAAALVHWLAQAVGLAGGGP